MRLRLGHCVVDLESGDVRRPDGSQGHLRPRELQVLSYLARQPPGTFSSDERLTREVWGYAESVIENTKRDKKRKFPSVPIVHHIRAEVEPNPREPVYVQNRPGHGYRLVDAIVETDVEIRASDERASRWTRRVTPEGLMRHRLVQGSPLVLVGARGTGKSTLIRLLLGDLAGPADRVAHLSVDHAAARSADLDLAAYRLQVELAEQLDDDESTLELTASEPGDGVDKLFAGLKYHLAARPGLLFLVIDPASGLTENVALSHRFLTRCRGALDAGRTGRTPWERLRLILTVSTTAMLNGQDPYTSPFNLSPKVLLGGFEIEETRDFLARHAIAATEDETDRLQAITNGNPGLLDVAAADIAVRGIGAVLEDPADERFGLGAMCDTLMAEFGQTRRVYDAVRAVARGRPDDADPVALDRLVAAGVLARGADRRFANELYTRFFNGRF
jgi:DNA-binding winged helix-turn-helix (wHTH) protein